jgi:putative spermidine/putrescine transport system permease protein
MAKKLIPLLFTVLCLLPLGLSIGYSFLYSIGGVGLLSEGLTLQHWGDLFRGEFLHSMLYSLWIALASAGGALGLALTALFTLRHHFQSNSFYRLLFLPLTIPPIVVAFVILQMYSGSGILSRLAVQSGLIDGSQQFPALVQDPYGIGILLAHLFIVFPFFLLVLLNLYQNNRLDEIERVASSLGADSTTIRFKLQLPILMRGLFPLLILYIIFFMGAYEIPLLLGQSSPQMISVLILEKLQRFNLGDIPVAYSMAVWYAAICIITISYLLMMHRSKEAI